MATKTTPKATAAKNTKTTKKPNTSKAVKTTAPRASEPKLSYIYEPIGMWGYFGYQFLFSIPVVGWILCIAFAFMAENVNLRNYARSQFCWIIIAVVIFCILALAGVLSTILRAFGVI